MQHTRNRTTSYVVHSLTKDGWREQSRTNDLSTLPSQAAWYFEHALKNGNDCVTVGDTMYTIETTQGV